MFRNGRVVVVVLAAVICFLGIYSCSTGGEGTETTTVAPPDPALRSALPPVISDGQPPADPSGDDPTTESTKAALPRYEPSQAAGAVVGVPAKTNTVPIVAVANYYTELPGFNLDVLENRQREHFLHRVNSEMCSCGCKNDTLARCLVNDSTCPLVKGMIQRVFDEIRAGS